MSDFLQRMQSLLGDEYEAFMRCYEGERFRGLRVNTLKCDNDALLEGLGLALTPTPFCPNGFYIPEGVEGLGNHPLHHAGAFYIQEPSATSAVEMLGVRPGEFVLDLCAAPGGKSTQIAAKLAGDGLLWSNEIVRSRANILLSNIERMGISNAVVSNSHPDVLCKRLGGMFDRVLVDAPCSGEGMFRKSDEAVAEWSVEHVKSCAERQLNILNSAALALRDGGVLVYSTCTFSPEENEGVITRFIEAHPEFSLEDSGASFGRPTLGYARRIFPQDGGEGHFAARLRKGAEAVSSFHPDAPPRAVDTDVLSFYDELFVDRPFGENIKVNGDRIIILPKKLNADLSGLNILRTGVLLGERVKRRIEPHHSAFAAAKPADCVSSVDFAVASPEIAAYLHGEEIAVPGNVKGYTAVSVGSMTVGFGKASNGRLKNKYPKGLRTLK